MHQNTKWIKTELLLPFLLFRPAVGPLSESFIGLAQIGLETTGTVNPHRAQSSVKDLTVAKIKNKKVSC